MAKLRTLRRSESIWETEPIHRVQHKWTNAERVLDDVKARAYESYLELKFMLFMGVGQGEAKAVTGGSIDWQEKEITFIRLKTGKPYSKYRNSSTSNR